MVFQEGPTLPSRWADRFAAGTHAVDPQARLCQRHNCGEGPVGHELDGLAVRLPPRRHGMVELALEKEVVVTVVKDALAPAQLAVYVRGGFHQPVFQLHSVLGKKPERRDLDSELPN